MREYVEPRIKIGAKGNAIIITIGILVLLWVVFGGKGTDTLGMNGYANTFDKSNPGSVKVFDIGVRSKVTVIRHGDETMSILAFRKVPLLDRWKVTNEGETYDPDKEKTVWVSVDDGFNRYFVISNGETLTVEENYGWDGTYARMLNEAVFALFLIILFEVGKRLWKRRTKKKAIRSIEG